MSDATPSVEGLPEQSPDASDDRPELSSIGAIERLPFELLSEIFACTEAAFRATEGPHVDTPWTPVYNLCRVSKRWRAVALDTPELWTCVTIMGVRGKQAAETWVEHARGRPITVWGLVVARGLVDDFLRRYAGQVEDACLTLPIFPESTDEVPVISHLPWPALMPRMNALELQHVPLSYGQLVSLLRTAPCLERLIAHVDDDLVHHTFHVPVSTDWTTPTHLTHLQVDTGFEDVDELCELLRLCPDLKFLSVDPHHIVAHGIALNILPDDHVAVELPSLQAASMPMTSFSKGLLRRLDTPVLERTVVQWPHYPNTTCKELEAALRAGNVLATEQAFSFKDDGDAVDSDGFHTIWDVIFFLSRNSLLEVLRVSGSPDNLNGLIKFLTTPNADGTFPLPRLRRLTLEWCRRWHGSLKGFDKRYKGVGVKSPKFVIPPPLESVDIIDCTVRCDFNAARRLFEEYGTKFRLETEGVIYDWDEDLMTSEEKEKAEACQSAGYELQLDDDSDQTARWPDIDDVENSDDDDVFV